MRRDDPRTVLARQWLVKAQRDLLLAERARQPPAVLEGITFHAQQAAEKALKGYLAWRNRQFKKTHGLPSLVTMCADLEPDFATLLDAAEALDEFIATGRYPDVAAEPTPATAEGAYRLAGQVVAFVISRLPPEARPWCCPIFWPMTCSTGWTPHRTVHRDRCFCGWTPRASSDGWRRTWNRR